MKKSRAIVISSMNISVKGAGETEIIHLPHPVAEWLRNLTSSGK